MPVIRQYASNAYY